MDPLSLAEVSVAVFIGVGGGITLGGYVVLGWAGEFVDETMTAVKLTALELLTNPTTQKLADAGSKLSKMVGKNGGGIMDTIINKGAQFLGLK